MNTRTTHDDANVHADEAAIRDLFRQLLGAWDRGDGDAYGALFTDDADYVAFDGSHTRGRRDIAVSHQQLFDKWMKGTRLVGDIYSIKFPSPDVAIVHATGGTVMRGKPRPAPERASVQTLVATRRDGEWRFVAFHNARVRPIGRNAFTALAWVLSDSLWKVLATKQWNDAQTGDEDAMDAGREPFSPLRASGVALLTTFRRGGEGVGTPVGVKVSDGKVYFTTWTTAGKVKRLASDPRVTLAPCTRRGDVTGPTVRGIARPLDEEPEGLPAKTLGDWLWVGYYKLRDRQPVSYEVSPFPEEQTPIPMERAVAQRRSL